MCGIAGFVAPFSAEKREEFVRPMLVSMARRGPDSEGLVSWPGATLGHRRLAILDLSDKGRQPMVSDDGQVGIVFNGCIYNFQDVRLDLEKKGHRFRSDCDTEVLLRGYEAWGIDALLPRLRGMFAFGIWDARVRKLFLVRDRLGVKPLVYAQRGDRIAFASTLSALRQAGLIDDLEPRAAGELLEFGWVSDRHTIFAGASKVQAGSVVEWRDGNLSSRRFWQLPQQTRAIRFDDAVEQTEALLLESVKLRLISDVPIAALLSGGIDSALVCWALSKLNANVRAFTVGTEGDPADESADARSTAQALGIPHEVIQLPRREQPALDDLLNAYGEPFACSSALGMLRVCQAVKPEATVLLTGDGGDDVFLGYPHHRTFWLAQRIANRLPSGFAAAWPRLRRLVPPSRGLKRMEHLIDYATGGLGAVTRVHDGLPFYEHAGILGPRFDGLKIADRAISPSFESARNLLPEYLAYEFQTRFVAEYMTKVDGGAMYSSLEARSPFLDQSLWEFAASLPISVRLHGELKAVLRALARKNLGPDIASRRKQGFTIPVSRWLPTAWRGHLQDLMDDSVLEQQGWLKRGSLGPVIHKALATGYAPEQLWYLVVWEAWTRKQTAPALSIA
jgi:asparagine synthase (glutamine-hydrolysing)